MEPSTQHSSGSSPSQSALPVSGSTVVISAGGTNICVNLERACEQTQAAATALAERGQIPVDHEKLGRPWVLLASDRKQDPRQCSTSASEGSSPMQRWMQERMEEQAYHNIGAIAAASHTSRRQTFARHTTSTAAATTPSLKKTEQQG